MNIVRTLLMAGLGALFVAGMAPAGEVSVKGVHLCCGGCVKAASAAFDEVEGVSDVTCDRNTKLIRLTVENDETAGQAIAALAKAGFHGEATHDKDKLAFPASGAQKGVQKDVIVLRGPHLCCDNCVKGTQEALKGLDGIKVIEVDRNTRIVRLQGEKLNVLQAVQALNDGGFHGEVVTEAE